MNIIIDGNAFLNVAVSIVKNILANDKRIGEKYYVSDLLNDDEFMLKQASKDSFKSFSLNYFGSILAPFKDNITSVFFVFDSKSWRKQYIKEHFESKDQSDFAYKGKRKYDDKIYLFFDYFQNEILSTISEEYGIISNRVSGAEGDDLIAYLCESLTDEDICIWSVDKDLTQLLESNRRRIILMMPKQMTKFKKIYTSLDFNTTEPREVSLFDLDISAIDNSSVLNVINDLIQKDYQHIAIDPTLDILTKCLAGDESDNIPRIHPKMTASKVSKVIESVKENFNWDSIISLIDSNDPSLISKINDITCEVLKIKEPGERLMIENNLNLNRILIRLSTKVFPKEVLDSIQKSINLKNRRRFNYYQFKKNYKNQ
jgi:5'-3' exonuclease